MRILKNSGGFTLIVLLLMSCGSQKIIKDKNSCYLDDTIESESFILDSTKIDRSLSYSLKTLRENDSIKVSINKSKYYGLCVEHKKAKIKNWFYYDTLTLKLKKKTSNYFIYNALRIGEAKYFNDRGEVTKVIDYRQKEKYPICYKQALMLVDKWKPKNYEINSIERDSIIYKKGTTYTWMVHVRHPIKPRNQAKTYLYTIDAKTGKKLKKVETRIGTNDDL